MPIKPENRARYPGRKMMMQHTPPLLPTSSSVFGGLKVIESPDLPRYTLPEEIAPGVPWPPGFRNEINLWSLSFLGTTNVVKEGEALVIGNHTAVMRPQDIKRLRAALNDRSA